MSSWRCGLWEAYCKQTYRLHADSLVCQWCGSAVLCHTITAVPYDFNIVTSSFYPLLRLSSRPSLYHFGGP
eukprot:COSAG05_NODE_840_length_7027_cov_416.630052_3_plen_71_part_00